MMTNTSSPKTRKSIDCNNKLGSSTRVYLKLIFYIFCAEYYMVIGYEMCSYSQLQSSIQAAKKANNLTDPTEPFSSFMKFNKNDLDLTMHFIKAPAMSSSLKEEIYSLIKDNMMEIYQKCPWGWKEKEKRAELFHKDARYILVRHPCNGLAAFLHFRFDIEDSIEVLYLYEIQLEKSVQGKGLGRYLMSLIETIAFHHNMKRIVLTVLRSEPKVVNFYFSLQYETEPYSPLDSFYYILGKGSKTLELDNN